MTALSADGAASLPMAGGDPFKNARELCERVVIVGAGEDESSLRVEDGAALAQMKATV